MSREVSTDALSEMFDQETGEVYAILLTLDHADLDSPIRVTPIGEGITSNGNDFSFLPFDISLPDDPDNGQHRARLAMDNVDRQIVQAIRSLNSAPTITIQIVRYSDPDVIEAEWTDFKLTRASYDKFRVEGDLTIEEFTTEAFPALTFSPSLFPGLF